MIDSYGIVLRMGHVVTCLVHARVPAPEYEEKPRAYLPGALAFEEVCRTMIPDPLWWKGPFFMG
ncbi:MAG: hypothetical protein MI923_16735 [Phycisphaerales bacterium]|nr:hypothetical protein [Phycisphaerales bacterium]